jgi:hypothetical protein
VRDRGPCRLGKGRRPPRTPRQASKPLSGKPPVPCAATCPCRWYPSLAPPGQRTTPSPARRRALAKERRPVRTGARKGLPWCPPRARSLWLTLVFFLAAAPRRHSGCRGSYIFSVFTVYRTYIDMCAALRALCVVVTCFWDGITGTGRWSYFIDSTLINR